MEPMLMLRSMGALCLVLGLLCGALWAARRFGWTLPVMAGGAARRLAVAERLSLDAKRSLLLVRRDGVEHLLIAGPEGVAIVERRIGAARADAAGQAGALAEPPASFARQLAAAEADAAGTDEKPAVPSVDPARWPARAAQLMRAGGAL